MKFSSSFCSRTINAILFIRVFTKIAQIRFVAYYEILTMGLFYSKGCGFSLINIVGILTYKDNLPCFMPLSFLPSAVFFFSLLT
ncbi:hypothetical protein ACJX0J_005967, partial [Zea mays]